MALVNVAQACLESLSQISEHLKDAILYLDGGCTESFQYLGAFPLLLNLGVRAVCSLESMSSLDLVVDWNSKLDPGRSIVVMTSRLLSDAHRYILRCLSSHQGVRRCTVFTNISEMAHSAYPDSPLGPDAFREYETLLTQDFEELVKKRCAKSSLEDDNFQETMLLEDDGWSQFTLAEDDIQEATSRGKDLSEDKHTHHDDVGQQLVVSVHHFPMIVSPLSPRAFVLPSEGSVSEACLSLQNGVSLSPGLPSLSSEIPSDVDDIPPGAILTAHLLYHFAAKMDLKMEIFSLGNLSKSVGKIMTDMSSLYDVGRRKRSAGLLLIDRTLDLLTPCCHGDSLIDRMISSLLRRKRIAAPGLAKGSQTQLKQGTGNLQRAPLDVQIPLGEFLSAEDGNLGSHQLSRKIDYFLQGWNSGSFASQFVDSVDIHIHNEKSACHEMDRLWGSLVATESLRGTPYLEALLDRRTKDGAVLVKKWLQEALRRENISTNVKVRPGSATRSELLPMIKALARSESSLIRNKGLIQVAAATMTALNEHHSSRWDAFISAEKILSATAGETSQSLAAQIGDLINKSVLLGSHTQKNGKAEKSEGLLSFQDALLLTVVGYILAGENFPTSGPDGPFSWQEEHLLKEAVVDAVLENPNIAGLKFLQGLKEELEANSKRINSQEKTDTPSKEPDIDDFDDEQWGSWGDEEPEESKDQAYGDMQLKLELRDRVDNLFKFFHKLSNLKSRNNLFGEGMFSVDGGFGVDPNSSKCLLYKLITRLLSKSDVPGLEYHSSTVGRLFKSGFGRLGLGQAKPSIADQNVILVFVIGGINCLEVREVQEAVSESGRPDVELIVGGTTLLTPADMLDLLLGQSSFI